MEELLRLAVARQAVAAVQADWCQAGGPAQDVTVWLDEAGDVCIWVNGGGTTPSAWGSGDTLTVSVAEYVQAELMEAGFTYQVLPTRPLHLVGLHPALTADGPAWWCRSCEHPWVPSGPCPDHEEVPLRVRQTHRVTYEPGDRVEYTAAPVFDLIITTGEVGIVTRVEDGWVFAEWPRSGEHSVPLAHVRPYRE